MKLKRSSKKPRAAGRSPELIRPRLVLEEGTARPEYLEGIWDYALGKGAREHRRYREAAEAAKEDGWDPGWIRTWQDVEATLQGCRFELARALHAVRFIGVLKHTKGQWAGRPFILTDVQRYDWVMPLFGWVRPDGTRRFRRASIWIPKKNGKTTVAAALVLYLLGFDGEAGAQVYSAAVDREQAAMIYRDAAAMVRGTRALLSRFVPIDSVHRIRYPETNSFYKALSAEAPNKEGLDIHGLVFDEIHALPKGELWKTLFHGDIARVQPLFASISTAGVYKPTSVGVREWDYALKVQSGAVTDIEYFPYVARADHERDDIEDPAVWRKANPSWGITVQQEEMGRKFARARQYPEELIDFKRYRINIWVQSITKYLDIAKWMERCGGAFAESELEGLPCWGGLDLSSKIDLTAAVWLFGPNAKGEFFVRPRFWMPAENVVPGQFRDNVPYGAWVAEGWLEVTPGEVVDYEFVQQAVEAEAGRWGMIDMGYDPWNGMETATKLQAAGLTMVEMRQGYKTLSDPTKELQRLVLSGKLRHGDHPMLKWMADNLVVDIDANGNVKPNKEKSVSKIDGMVALIMALGRKLGHEDGAGVVSYTGFYGD